MLVFMDDEKVKKLGQDTVPTAKLTYRIGQGQI